VIQDTVSKTGSASKTQTTGRKKQL